jgi:aldehyde dehydrogenase (NAD+)
MSAVFERQQAHAGKIRHSAAADRIEKLTRLSAAILERRGALRQALESDFRKPPEEVDLTEIVPLLLEIRHAQRHVGRWMQPTKAATSLPLLGTTAEIQYDPKGVALIISPWNYPWLLALGPLVSAIAAGNCVILKPSEFTPATSDLLGEMISAIFPQDEVAVFKGDHTVAAELLDLPFDHVFFTGSPAVGRIVMRAAARTLASVTLELGGKSPVIIDESADLKSAALSIMWGKYQNAGQTCVAPDFVLVPKNRHDEFVRELVAAAQKLEGTTQIEDGGFAFIVSDRHADRIRGLLRDAEVGGAQFALGASEAGSGRMLPPSVLTNVSWDSKIMSEEIFGPVLPLMTYDDLSEAVDRLARMPVPLALYVFAEDPAAANFWIENTRSGGAVVNDIAIHFANPDLPFGGIQNSGIGRSHGHAGFLAFSNERSVMRQRLTHPPIRQLYPPYGPRTRRLVEWLLRYVKSGDNFRRPRRDNRG